MTPMKKVMKTSPVSKDKVPRMPRGTAGTFAGRREPINEAKAALFCKLRDTFNQDRLEDKAMRNETKRAKASPQDFWVFFMHKHQVKTLDEFDDVYNEWNKVMCGWS